MKTISTLTLTSLLLALPSLALAQKPGKPVAPVTPKHVVVHHATVHTDVPKPKTDKDAAEDAAERAAKTANKTAVKTEKAEEKTEHRELVEARHDERLLHGIKLTAAERTQINTIEKNYDAQLRALSKTEKADDRTARKNQTAESDASFQTQLTTLETQERADIRAALTASQQTQFDANVAKLSKPKH
jgi:hypothetical protein